MRVEKILTDSVTEIHEHITDIIFFQGCYRDCNYCFNPELKGERLEDNMTVEEIVKKLSPMSDAVVFTGGEPLIQDQNQLVKLVNYIHYDLEKKIVLETAKYSLLWKMFHKVLFCIKTWEADKQEMPWNALNLYTNNIPVVVYGHDQFDMEGFKKAMKTIKGDIYVRYKDDIACDTTELRKVIKQCGKRWKIFKKIWI